MLSPARVIDESHDSLAPASAPSAGLIVLGSILLSAGVLVLPWWTGMMHLFQYLYLVLALFVGVVLYRTTPILYLGFTWWLWFLSQFVSRFIDYQLGAMKTDFIPLTPYLVGGLTVLTVLRYRARLLDRDYFPFVLVLAGIAYSYAIGIVNNGLVTATSGLLKWMVPVFFGLHIALHWRDYPAMRQGLQRTFLWGVVVMGLYAVLQFYALPEWDRFWMINAEWDLSSTGRPRPLMVRIYSTMSDFGTFATVMMAGVLVLFSLSVRKHLLAAVPGYAGFLLTVVRSAWGGWVMAIMMMALWIKGRMRRRLFGALLLGALILAPLASTPEIANRLSNRFGSFQNLEDDRSMEVRIQIYRNNSLRALTSPLGEGIGIADVNWDSGLLMIAYRLGWPGLLVFAVGLLMLLRLLWRSRIQIDDPFASICVAIAFAILALLAFNNQMVGVRGATFWCFAGLAVASYRYHRAEEEEDEYEEEVWEEE